MYEEMFAVWSMQNCHDDLVSEVYGPVLTSNQKELYEQFFSPQERKLWHESDLKE